jgi:tryptophanase
VTQEVLITLWEHQDELDENGVLPWLMRVTRNACIDRPRARQRRRKTVRADPDGVDRAPSPSRTPEAIVRGLQEIVDEDYLECRVASIRCLGEALTDLGVPIVKPVGGHAVCIDAKALLPHIPPLEHPTQSLAVALHVTGGICGVEIGSVVFGRQPDGSEALADQELLRLAIPRRVYTQSHVDYVVECFEELVGRKDALCGYAIPEGPPQLRHFTARFRPLSPRPSTTRPTAPPRRRSESSPVAGQAAPRAP